MIVSTAVNATNASSTKTKCTSGLLEYAEISFARNIRDPNQEASS